MQTSTSRLTGLFSPYMKSRVWMNGGWPRLQMRKNLRRRLRALSAGLLVLAMTGSAAWADFTLPSPDQLINMSINDRLGLYSTINMLPPDKRDAKLAELKQEIDAMTPAQKQAMVDHFKTEFEALPPDKQDALKKQLGYPQ